MWRETSERIRGLLGDLWIGDNYPTRIVGVINVSPESFYKGSIRLNYEDVAEAAKKMERDGADVIDIGGMSTAPYLETLIEEDVEAKRISWAIEAVKSSVKLPISADTSRLKPAIAAIKAGADIINDVTGLRVQPRIARLVAEHGLSLILCASKLGRLRDSSDAPMAAVKSLRESIQAAIKDGVEPNRIIIDPGIGFHRSTGLPWFKVDLSLLRGLRKLRVLGKPIIVGVSRKSFLGAITGRDKPEERLASSIAAEAIAVILGAHGIRVHDVAEALDAVRVAEAIIGYEFSEFSSRSP
ncbi:MAG: dihydropteroate synthase [Thaumarchaeota archaeon]|nr:MAG: dihydropteroate synthase [Nitrososphaerota archaeon]